jgi:hypothetical protein
VDKQYFLSGVFLYHIALETSFRHTHTLFRLGKQKTKTTYSKNASSFWPSSNHFLFVCLFDCLLEFLQPEHTNVCFWYIPQSLRGVPDSPERREKLHRVRMRSFCLRCTTAAVWLAGRAILVPPSCSQRGRT